MMIEQVETNEIELNAEELDLVQGGLTCRKAGGEQQDYTATSGGQSIIAI